MIGTIVIPAAILLVAVPACRCSTGSSRRRLAHFLACGFVFALVGGAGYLTVEALQDRRRRPAVPGGPQEGRRGAGAGAAPGRPPAAASPRTGPGTSCSATRSPTGTRCSRRSAWAATSSTARGRRADRLRPEGLRLARLDSRPARESRRPPAYFGKVPECDGMAEWKKSSKLKAKAARRRRRLRGLVRQDPADMTPDEWLEQPGRRRAPRQRAVPEGMRPVPHRSRATPRGARATRPSLFAWGSPQWIARMIRKPGAAGPLRLPRGQGPDARVRPRPVDRQRRRHGHPLPEERLPDRRIGRPRPSAEVRASGGRVRLASRGGDEPRANGAMRSSRVRASRAPSGQCAFLSGESLRSHLMRPRTVESIASRISRTSASRPDGRLEKTAKNRQSRRDFT